MTEKTQIRIEEILDRTTKEGKHYKVLRNNGDGFFVWDSKLLEGIKTGDTVELTHTGGKYPKVETIKKVESEGFDFPEPKKFNGKSESGTNARTALITAKELVIAYVKDLKFDNLDALVQETIKHAQTFKNFLNEAGE